MTALTVPAYAKINLTLDVLGKRPDGYHDVEMVMQTIELHDLITLTDRSERGIGIRCNHPFVPTNSTNLAYRAAELLLSECGIERGVEIEIVKNIPVAAGLAGGSTNAAGVFIGLNELWQLGLTQAELRQLGARLGADVPFCIGGGTALATGIGTELQPLPPLPVLELVLYTPGISVSTREIYTNYTPELVKRRPATAQMIDAINQKDARAIKANLVNVLEPITLHYYPKVAEALELMESIGMHTVMSGSGPTLFSVVEDAKDADLYAAALEARVPEKVFRTRTK